jgi:hypothetical protein
MSINFSIIRSSNKTQAFTIMSRLYYSATWNAFWNTPSTLKESKRLQKC